MPDHRTHQNGRAANDVGAWFSSASSRAIPRIRTRAWGPTTGYGSSSKKSEIAAAAHTLLLGPVLILTGAGVSTGAGLPDYRGPNAKQRTPMLYQEFVSSHSSRSRFWARSTLGWPIFQLVEPGPVHHKIHELENRIEVVAVVTQNVDGLHQRAGSTNVIDLHGRIDQVVCLSCQRSYSRAQLQPELERRNAAWLDRNRLAPLGPDAHADAEDVVDFDYPSWRCGGILKPDVVFFGENARPEAISRSRELLAEAEILLVLGSSLSVLGGLRFCTAAAQAGKPVVIANDGDTRADELATQRIRGRLEEILPSWLTELNHCHNNPEKSSQRV